MDFILEQIRVGGDRNLGYLVGDRARKVAAAVDPAFSPTLFLERAEAQGLKITHILNTHGHSDHTNGNAELKRRTGALVAAHPRAGPDLPLADGSTLPIGSIAIRVLHVPGHTDDHVLFYLPREKVAITGDLLFVGKVGGTSTDAEARAEFESLARVMRDLPPETTVWPGHDYGCRPASTLRLEALANPFLLAKDLPSFLELKRTWADYKQRNGLK